MLAVEELSEEAFTALFRLDEQLAQAVAETRCVHCGGPLHVANYRRKPRGGAIAAKGEAFTLRHSLCCGRRGCRKRTMPPSLRFLGRRVYLEVVVLFAAAYAQAAGALNEAREVTRVPAWTLRRWLSWWQEHLAQQTWWMRLRAQSPPSPPDESDLPRSLIARLRKYGSSVGDVALQAAMCLAPVTTRSPIEAARFVRAVVGAAAGT
jgi:hypothetical protein